MTQQTFRKTIFLCFVFVFLCYYELFVYMNVHKTNKVQYKTFKACAQKLKKDLMEMPLKLPESQLGHIRVQFCRIVYNHIRCYIEKGLIQFTQYSAKLYISMPM